MLKSKEFSCFKALKCYICHTNYEHDKLHAQLVLLLIIYYARSLMPDPLFTGYSASTAVRSKPKAVVLLLLISCLLLFPFLGVLCLVLVLLYN